MTLQIHLLSGTQDDLKWEKEIEEARGAGGEKIEWIFDLGLNTPFFPLDDELQFHSLSLALDRFTKEIYPEFSDQTDRIVLFQGSCDFSRHFIWSEAQEKNWEAWKTSRPLSNLTHMKRLYCADAYAYYFQMLAHKLPDEAKLSLNFEIQKGGSRAELEELLSKERFEHFEIIRKGGEDTSSAPLALLFPETDYCTQEILDKLDRLIEKLKKPFRVIGEPFLTEEWGGVDQLLVLREALSPLGLRKLQGFSAAGGSVVTEGDLFGLPSEITSFEFFSKR